MKSKFVAGVVAVTLGTAGLAMAQNSPVKEIPVQSHTTVSPEISALMSEHPNLQALSDDQLRQRIQKLEGAIASPGLPPQVKDLLTAYAGQTNQELARRATGAADVKAKAAVDAKAAADAKAA